MAYHSFIPSMKRFIYDLQQPRILEVGNDRGTTLIPLAVFLARTKESFRLMGIDVMHQESLLITIDNIERSELQRVELVQANSLHELPKLVDCGNKFDLILLDGDHNYHTVARELDLLASLADENALIVIDDYNGRWANRDLFYAERPEYANCKDATARVETTKHGVKAAVDDFLAKSFDWVVAFKRDNIDFIVLKRA